MNSPMKDGISAPPSAQSKPGGEYSDGTHIVPVKIREDIGPAPGKLDSPFSESIEGLGHPPTVPSPGKATFDSPFKDGNQK